MNRKKPPSKPDACTRAKASAAAQANSSTPVADNSTAGPLIYRKATLLPLLGVSETTLRRWIDAEGFPRPRQLGPRAVGWVAAQVDQWLAERPVACGTGPA